MPIRRLPNSILQAYGGNALKESGENGNTVEAQERAMAKAAKVICSVSKQVKETLVVHGNGPQVGWMLRRAEIALPVLHPVPLRNVVAASQGPIGVTIARQVANCDSSLRGRVVEVGTQVRVDRDDPAFANPQKPIGNWMTEKVAEFKSLQEGWDVKNCVDGPPKTPWRRVVPSPEPLEIAEIESIRLLMQSGIIPICVGGGGVPYVVNEKGQMQWVDAVIDKDKAAALAAMELEMEMLAIFTGQVGIYDPDDFNKLIRGDSSVAPRTNMTVQELRDIIPYLPAGSMGPKAEAVARFVEKTGNPGWIGPLENGFEALTEGGGTIVEG
jgi:carbamate kinase